MSDQSDRKKRRLEEENTSSDSRTQVNRLTSLLPATSGGLQRPRSSANDAAAKPSGQETKSRGTSLLGLDHLAEQKRREQQHEDKKPSKPSFRKTNRKQGNFRRRESDDPTPPAKYSDRRGDRDRGGDFRRDHSHNEDRYGRRRDHEKNDSRQGERDSNSNKQVSDHRPHDERQNRPPNLPPPGHGISSYGSGRQDRPQKISPNRPSREHGNKEPHKNSKDTTTENAPYDSDGEDFDRQFYLADEGGYVVDASEMDASGQLGRFLFVNDKTKAREKEMEERRRNPMYKGGKGQQQQSQQQFLSARQSAMLDDQEAWEENRLLSSGAASRGEIALDVSTENDTRVTLLVHQLKPPFLEKSSVGLLGKQSAVATVKDNSSDFCKMAREGSATLRRLRQEKDKNTMRQKFWELGGSKMGNAMGVKKEEPKVDPDNQLSQPPEAESGELDYKKSTGYASHMNKHKKEAVSTFAKTKSIRQQREFLPIFSVRDEFLNVVRENNVVVSYLLSCHREFPAYRLTSSPHLVLFLSPRLPWVKQVQVRVNEDAIVVVVCCVGCC